MSTMSRSLIFALILGTARAAEVYEWKGVFYTPEDTYHWLAQKVKGKYADPKMKFVAIPVAGATADELTKASGSGTEALGMECEEVKSGGTIVPAEKKCYSMVFDQDSKESKYIIDASKAGSIAFFCEHVPTEFEDTDHYFKDTTGVDIEPVAQEPEPGADGHSHGHGGPEAWKSLCVCQGRENGWKLDCSNKKAIDDAVAKLDGEAKCKATDPPKDTCLGPYHVMQAHHDHCLHDQLPDGIEKKLHAYEHFYDDCFIKRQFDPDLKACPQVDCADAKAMTTAISTLQAGCATKEACADKTCADAIKLVLAVHDLCPEDSLPNNLEVALHDYEDPCAAQLCNTAEAAFDPYADLCGAADKEEEKKAATGSSTPAPADGEASAASGFGSHESFLVTALALPLAVLLTSQ